MERDRPERRDRMVILEAGAARVHQAGEELIKYARGVISERLALLAVEEDLGHASGFDAEEFAVGMVALPGVRVVHVAGPQDAIWAVRRPTLVDDSAGVYHAVDMLHPIADLQRRPL